ncbi:alpha-S2-casein isoform X5 [Macaca mulatta]
MDSINMKFFIFTCLLAIALAKHHMEHHSSREEDICSSSCKETTRNMNEMQPSSSSSSENKISPFYQKWNFLPFLQVPYQHHIVMNPGDQHKTSVYPFVPTLESASISHKETPKKTVNMESTEVFTDVKKNQPILSVCLAPICKISISQNCGTMEKHEDKCLPSYPCSEGFLRFLNSLLLLYFDRYPVVGLLDQMVALLLVLEGISTLFSIVAVLVYIPTSGV